ncbi:MAG: acylneuraminate cytidylyltransferase family protein [Anaerolineales bacterium]|nr:acylneuraminate cytidylyltransferase family protein [Anaerolineales bacterium]
MTKIAALVPMRHHSQRVPGKNFRPLGGKPLYHYIIETLLAVPEISDVVVDTDSPDIIAGLGAHFPSVVVLERPAHLRPDEIPMNEVLMYDTSQVEADFYIQTHSTNPVLRSKTISKAIQFFLANYPAFDSLFSVTRFQTRLWDHLGRAINHNPMILLQTQVLSPVYEENSCIYIFRRETLVARRNRLGERPMMFEISVAEAWDIDEELDFAITDFLMKKGLNPSA